MKHSHPRYSLKLVTLALLAFVTSNYCVPSLKAQTKIGYIDASKLLKRMPEAVDAETRMGQLVAGWTHEADDIQNDLNRKTLEFERRKLIMSDAERNAAQVEIQNLKKKGDDYKQEKYGPSGELYTQETQMMKPAYDRLQKAIEDVAHDLSYDFVFDKSSKDVVMLYANARHDLTLAVAKKLNIETDALTQPLIAPPANQQKGAQPAANGQTPNGTQPPPDINKPVIPPGGAPPGAPPTGTPPVTPAH
jgi:outer membrane protein